MSRSMTEAADQPAGMPGRGLSVLDVQVLQRLDNQARDRGIELTGEGGLLQQLTGTVFRPASQAPARERPKAMRARQLRSSGVDSLVLSLSARGLSRGEISAHFADVYGASVSAQAISAAIDRGVEGMARWQHRPLDAVYPVLFIDAITVTVRDTVVASRPVYVALAVTVDGKRDILGLWTGNGTEDAGYWLRVLTGIRGRGVTDVCITVACDALPGLPEAVRAVWPRAITQTCVIPLLRNTLRHATRGDAVATALRRVCTAPTRQAAEDHWLELARAWGGRYPAIAALWRDNWPQFVTFLRLDVEIRRVICCTDALERVTTGIRRAVRGHFPDDQAALKSVYLAVMSLEPAGKPKKHWTPRWKAALSAFSSTFGSRLTASSPGCPP